MATYGTVVAPGLATVMSLYPCDETRAVPYVGVEPDEEALRCRLPPRRPALWHRCLEYPYLSDSIRRSGEPRKGALGPAEPPQSGQTKRSPPLLWASTFTMGMDVLAGMGLAARGLR